MKDLHSFDPQYASASSRGRAVSHGYALWKFSAQGWELTKDCSAVNAVNSGPPTVPGLFPGHIRATPSVAA